MKYNNIIGHQIRTFRREKGLSLQQFTTELQLAGWNISLSAIRKIESRSRVVPDFELGYFTEAFGVDITALFPMQPFSETAHQYLRRVMSGDC